MEVDYVPLIASALRFSQPHIVKRLFLLLILFLHQCLTIAKNGQPLPPVVSVPPSTYWDGTFVPWSTFFLSIGTPPQAVRLIPSTSGNSIWPVLPGGCTPEDKTTCGVDRGSFFEPNKSSSWTGIGDLGLDAPAENARGYWANNASFGFDNTTFKFSSNSVDQTFSQPHQIIEGIETKQIDIGVFGLSPRPINFSSDNTLNPSLLASLKNESKIPSLSWGYTAGAGYRAAFLMFTTLGSLTLGGYDQSRFVGNSATFPFGPDPDRELVAGLQGITTNTSSSPVFSGNADVFFDSTTPDIWLPPQACEGFENVLGLQYVASQNRYFANQSMLYRYDKEEPLLSYVFNSPETGTVTLSLPLISHLNVSSGNSTNAPAAAFFSLRRAQNASQYTLGRAFLQETYLIADYERANFSISQAIFPEASVPQQLVAIHPPDDPDPPQGGGAHSPSLSAGPIAAVVLGATTIILSLTSLFLWRIKKSKQASSAEKTGFSKPELHSEPSRRVEVTATPVEKVRNELRESGILEILSSIDGEEMPTLASRAELPAPTAELEGSRLSLRRPSTR